MIGDALPIISLAASLIKFYLSRYQNYYITLEIFG